MDHMMREMERRRTGASDGWAWVCELDANRHLLECGVSTATISSQMRFDGYELHVTMVETKTFESMPVVFSE